MKIKKRKIILILIYINFYAKEEFKEMNWNQEKELSGANESEGRARAEERTW